MRSAKMILSTLAACGLIMVASPTVEAGPIGFSVRSNVNGHLYRIDLETGVATDLGEVGLFDAEGLASDGERLYAIGGGVEEFWDVTAPPGFKIGDTGERERFDAGLAYDPTSGRMYNIQTAWPSYLYEIDMKTGWATLISEIDDPEPVLDNLAINGDGVAYSADFLITQALYQIDLATAEATYVGDLNAGFDVRQAGSAFDPFGTLWAITEYGQRPGIYKVDTSTGNATWVSDVTLDGELIWGFEGLGIIPEPTGLALLAAGGAALLRRRRSVCR